MTTVHFADGRTFDVPPSWNNPTGTNVHGIDPHGNVFAHSDGIWFGLTMCCGASFKGMAGGIGCRSCYQEADGSDTPWGDVTHRADPVAWVHPRIGHEQTIPWGIDVDLVIPTNGPDPEHFKINCSTNTFERNSTNWRLELPPGVTGEVCGQQLQPDTVGATGQPLPPHDRRGPRVLIPMPTKEG